MEDSLYKFVREHLFESIILVGILRAAVIALIEPDEGDSKWYRWFYGFCNALPFSARIFKKPKVNCKDCPLKGRLEG